MDRRFFYNKNDVPFNSVTQIIPSSEVCVRMISLKLEFNLNLRGPDHVAK